MGPIIDKEQGLAGDNGFVDFVEIEASRATLTKCSDFIDFRR
jgi:hypothetical protein